MNDDRLNDLALMNIRIHLKNRKTHKNRSLRQTRNLYINLACLLVCLSVCLYPINVKTAEPIGPKLCVGPHESR